MGFLGAFLFYAGLLATVGAILKLIFNYSSKIGIQASRKIYKNESHEKQDKNEVLANEWIKSNIKSIIWRLCVTIAGFILLQIYWPEMLPW